MFRKFASAAVIDVKTSPQRVTSFAGHQKLAEMSFKDYQTKDGYVYVRVRAISSRVNLNHDGWPAAELKRAYRTFVGKPIFVDHHNHDPKRARGVVVDAELHEEDGKTSALDDYYSSSDVDPEHLPATWIELLLEIDGKRYPKFAKAFVNGEIDSVSMGADVEYTKCSHCGNEATDPDQFCRHIIAKGAYFDYYKPNGQKVARKSYENCYKIAFFELSGVFVPADPTALAVEVKSSKFEQTKAVAQSASMWDAIPPKTAGEIYDQENPPEDEPPQFMSEEEVLNQPVDPHGGEAQQVYEWRYQQALKMGYDPAEAEEIAKQEYRGTDEHGTPKGIDLHWLQNAINWGASPQEAWQLHSNHVSTLRREASVKKAQDNPIPQSDMTRMPEHVDTLRQEDICPVCGSDMEDGECTLCGYVEPPEGFNNPNLEKAKQVDEQLRGEQEPSEEPMDQQNEVTPNDVAGASSTTDPTLAKYHFATTNPDGAVALKGRIAAQTTRIRTQEKPLLPAGRRNSDKPLAVRTLKNPTKPIESNYTEKDIMAQKIADGASPQGEGTSADNRVDVLGVGAVSGDPLSGIEHENVEKDTGNFVAPHTDTWSGGEGDSLGQQDPVTSEAFEGAGGNGNSSGNAVGVSSPGPHASSAKTACDLDADDCHDDDCPKHGSKHAALRIEANKYIKERDGKWVIIQKGTGKVLSTHDSQEKAQASFEAMEAHKHGAEKTADTANDLGGPWGESAGTDESLAGNTNDKGSAPGFPDHDPAHVDLGGSLREEVGDHTRTFGSDDFHITDPVTKGENANSLGGPIGNPAPTTALSSFGFAVKAMKLAEAEERMGLTRSKWERVAELEDKSEEYIDAAWETVSKVRTASVRRQAATKTAGRVPSFRGTTASFQPEAHSTEGVNTEDALFY